MKLEFRVWDKVNKVYDFPTQIDIDDSGHIGCVDTYHGSLVDGDFVLEQYTGLKDANGNKIFESDIVHGYDQEPDRDDGYIGSSVTDVVNFKYGAFWIGDSWYKVMVMTPPIVEIIGNIHENPELLEVDK